MARRRSSLSARREREWSAAFSSDLAESVSDRRSTSALHAPNANANGVPSTSPGLPELVEGYPGSTAHE
jgi:hypothetical protein